MVYVLSTLASSADVFSSPAPFLSSTPLTKTDTGTVMNLFGGG